jgi:hypothetical protein
LVARRKTYRFVLLLPRIVTARMICSKGNHPTTPLFSHHASNMPALGCSKDDSLRSRTSSNALTDNLLSMRFQPPLHLRDSLTVHSLLPRRTPQEQREFLASILSQALAIVDDDYDFYDDDDDSTDDAQANESSA